jgi:hypothetical protein
MTRSGATIAPVRRINSVGRIKVSIVRPKPCAPSCWQAQRLQAHVASTSTLAASRICSAERRPGDCSRLVSRIAHTSDLGRGTQPNLRSLRKLDTMLLTEQTRRQQHRGRDGGAISAGEAGRAAESDRQGDRFATRLATGASPIAARFETMPHARGVRSPYEDRSHGSGICSTRLARP